jgi:hypothetical protein
MVKVSIEVRSGASRFDMAVWAERIERAVNLVGGSHPAYDAGVTFPIDPEGYFVEDPAAQARTAGFDRLGAMVA